MRGTLSEELFVVITSGSSISSVSSSIGEVAHLVICLNVSIRTRSFIFILLMKIPIKLMKANSTKATKTMEKHNIT